MIRVGILRGVLMGIGLLLVSAPVAQAAIFATYSEGFTDSWTDDNAFQNAEGKRRYTIDPGADSYQHDFYERPTTQTYKVETVQGSGEQRFATNEYFSNLDIDNAQVGFDGKYLYVRIDMRGLSKHTEDGTQSYEGLKHRYGFRMSKAADGAGGMLLVVDDPAGKSAATTFNGNKAFAYLDTNGDVGGSGAANGLSITKQDNYQAAKGNGFDYNKVADGKIGGNGEVVLFTRINPLDATVVEFALEYAKFGYTAADLQTLLYLEFEAIKGGPKDSQNYLWNDEYTKSEAGSPYRATMYDLSKSEFRTQGLGNIYMLDTLRGNGISPAPTPTAPVPEPTSLVIFAGLGILLAARHKLARARTPFC